VIVVSGYVSVLLNLSHHYPQRGAKFSLVIRPLLQSLGRACTKWCPQILMAVHSEETLGSAAPKRRAPQTRSCSHAFDSVYPIHGVEMVIKSISSIVPSGHSASTDHRAPSPRTMQNIGFSETACIPGLQLSNHVAGTVECGIASGNSMPCGSISSWSAHRMVMLPAPPP